ncbi:hypothetical protein B7486_51710 [cyanobacterium TDX16]|nr:hypothetical protein B7486_51710 [cyanobacterium TDX16]
MTQTIGDRILPLITTPEVYAWELTGYRYFVELVSNKTQLQDDRPIPVHTQVVDVVVTQPTINALFELNEVIAQLISTCDWLKGYSILSYNAALSLAPTRSCASAANEASFDEAPF